MADAYRIRITPRALADLEAAFAFIERDSPQNASGMIRRLMDAIEGLSILPRRYAVPRVGETRNENMRSMPVWPFLVRYRIAEKTKTVFVLRIRHGARRRP